MSAQENKEDNNFQLSASISGFSQPLRAVASPDINEFAVAEQKGKMAVYKRSEDGRTFTKKYAIIQDHKSLTICLETINGQYISGGANNCAHGE